MIPGTRTPARCWTPSPSWAPRSRYTRSPVSRRTSRRCPPAAAFILGAPARSSAVAATSRRSIPSVAEPSRGAGSPSRPPMGEPLLEVRDLKKYFPVGSSLLGRPQGWVKAVDGISFTINGGETLGLVGESGCGKTTTSKLILAAEETTAGVIEFEGRRLADLDDKQRMDYRR